MTDADRGRGIGRCEVTLILLSAAGVVVAILVLVAGMITSNLLSVYISIGIGAAAAVMLAIGVFTDREALLLRAPAPNEPAAGAGAAPAGAPATPASGAPARGVAAAVRATGSGSAGKTQGGEALADEPAVRVITGQVSESAESATPVRHSPAAAAAPGTGWTGTSGAGGPAQADAPDEIREPSGTGQRIVSSSPQVGPRGKADTLERTEPREEAGGQIEPAGRPEPAAEGPHGPAEEPAGQPETRGQAEPGQAGVTRQPVDGQAEPSREGTHRPEEPAGQAARGHSGSPQAERGQERPAGQEVAITESADGRAINVALGGGSQGPKGALADMAPGDVTRIFPWPPSGQRGRAGAADAAAPDLGAAAGRGSGPSGDATAALAQARSPDVGNQAAQVWLVRGVSRYHQRDCVLIQVVDDEDVDTMPLAEADSIGCTPCRACHMD